MDFNYVKVKSLEHLDELLEQGNHDFVIASGCLRSSKFIDRNEDGTYYVLHLIDGSEENLSAEELMEYNIGTAIRNGCFYCEPD